MKLSELSATGGNLFIAGDFNLPTVDWSSTDYLNIRNVTRGLFGWSKTTPARSFVAFGPNFLKIVDAGRKRHGHWPLLYLI
jgi:hypothetical protein